MTLRLEDLESIRPLVKMMQHNPDWWGVLHRLDAEIDRQKRLADRKRNPVPEDKTWPQS